MIVVVVTPRAGEIIELEMVKRHLRVEHDDDDDLIALYVEAVISWLDGPAGWLGRSLGPQTLSAQGMSADANDGDVRLPYGPVTAIDAVAYVGVDGATVPVSEDDWTLVANRVRPAAGVMLPDNLTIQYVAGHEPADLPRAISAAVLMMVGDLYGGRETGVVGTISADVRMTTTAERLLSPWRQWHA